MKARYYFRSLYDTPPQFFCQAEKGERETSKSDENRIPDVRRTYASYSYSSTPTRVVVILASTYA